MALSDYLANNPYAIQAQTAPRAAPSYQQNLQDPNQMVQDSLEAMLDPSSSYIKNARQRGIEYAASRGGLNSSIAAGAAERSAIEAAAPLAQQAVGIQQSREQVAADDWLSNQNFNRSIQGQVALMPLRSSFDMLNTIQQYALQDPALYTPEVTSGYSNFFQKNMNDIMSNYFKGYDFGM